MFYFSYPCIQLFLVMRNCIGTVLEKTCIRVCTYYGIALIVTIGLFKEVSITPKGGNLFEADSINLLIL